MNKTALKNFATNARKELIEKVKARAFKIGITVENIKKAQFESSDAIYIDGKQLSAIEKKQREKLISRIKEIGYTQVVEEVAYTWFNRFTALRYMEVNNYLPTKVRVLSSSYSNTNEPDIIREALNVDLDIDKELVYDLKLNNKTEDLFKYLVIKQCNNLNKYLPFMFETIEDYKEILFPGGLLGKDSFLRAMTDVTAIPEFHWEQVEIIGWLYQFYISEEKERVFREKKKFQVEEIPFATQLFTPDWIVRYMVENSLGRYWTESHQEHSSLTENWEYFINSCESEDFDEKIISNTNKGLRIEDIKCFDPAMGSGHILVYLFDVLYEIYLECGYMETEIPRMIIEKNLYGLDIDHRAYQLACFSVVMKALAYNKRFFRSIEKEGLTLHLAPIEETNLINEEELAFIAGEKEGANYHKVKKFVEQFLNAKTYGSLIKIADYDRVFLEHRLDHIKVNPAKDIFEVIIREKVLSLLPQLLRQADIMVTQYDVLVTNPPYMGYGNMNLVLSDFLKKNYPDSKSDLFACFMEIDHYLKAEGYYAAVNQHSWMFLASYEKLREKIIRKKTISTMVHLGTRAFEEIGGEVVQSTAFVLRREYLPNNKGIFLRLIDEKTAKDKRDMLIKSANNEIVSQRYSFDQRNFAKVPGIPIAYWLNESLLNLFEESQAVSTNYEVRNGITTGENGKFIRYWHEIDFCNNSKWLPCNKGGSFRKWYGNKDYVIDWEDDGKNLKTFVDHKGKPRATLRGIEYNFEEAITISRVSSSDTSYRWLSEGFITESASNNIYSKQKEDKIGTLNLMGWLNTKVSNYIMKIYNPTINIMPDDIRNLPLKFGGNDISNIVRENIKISRMDWDNFETSWDFMKHPLIQWKVENGDIEDAFEKWSNFTERQFLQLKSNEEELNRIFIEVYCLQKELTHDVDDKDVSIRKADLKRDMKSLISYAIGCMFGRYSLDVEGLIFAGGKFDLSKYISIKIDKDNIIPIADQYLDGDITSLFTEFVRVTFGEVSLEKNLQFIAESLGKKDGETAKEAIRRYFLNEFFKDHLQTYRKKPIYWLFTSGKQKAFNCLIYMHRYDKSTLSRIRTDYLHELQIRMDAEKKSLLDVIIGEGTTKEIANAKKELKSLELKIEELRAYDEKLHHMADMQIEIDLDDGVAVNYAKFESLLAPIK
ncbi:restriction endonuclease [Paenibacillus sp. FSL H7-0357]|uniref:BREX-1 system adenine-specific DNA-methyltransferase PglX n=1 Tax=Paenibacillus sp. FSL H7-0357 TaxID=1536774 RepID=UPI0004F5E332|nr:BREX-1 system adenine-specific DNA-methyltransferase PglX [Paenibacillus sp. FSL H7-0357]AIQ20664.1 restriction endonuclease [Paenibacillus sp. FSL H7-0357]